MDNYLIEAVCDAACADYGYECSECGQPYDQDQIWCDSCGGEVQECD